MNLVWTAASPPDQMQIRRICVLAVEGDAGCLTRPIIGLWMVHECDDASVTTLYQDEKIICTDDEVVVRWYYLWGDNRIRYTAQALSTTAPQWWPRCAAAPCRELHASVPGRRRSLRG